MSEAGAKANAICLSLAETAKANLPIHQQSEILHNYMPWSKNIQATCAK